mgnify:FL=1
MRHRFVLFCSFVSMLLFASCSKDDAGSVAEPNGSGTISLSVAADANFKSSRAVSESDYKNADNYTVKIMQGEEEIASFLYKDKASSYKLDNGNYTLKAYYGEEFPASRDKFYVVGTKEFTVDGNDVNVKVDCEPTCGKLVVNFDTKMSEFFSNYYVTYETKALTAAGTECRWAKDDTEPWYVKLDAAGEVVKATVHYTVKSSNKEGTQVLTYKTTDGVEKMMPNKSWTLNISPKDNNGSLSITITIDENTNDRPIKIVVPTDWLN